MARYAYRGGASADVFQGYFRDFTLRIFVFCNIYDSRTFFSVIFFPLFFLFFFFITYYRERGGFHGFRVRFLGFRLWRFNQRAATISSSLFRSLKSSLPSCFTSLIGVFLSLNLCIESLNSMYIFISFCMFLQALVWFVVDIMIIASLYLLGCLWLNMMGLLG